MSKKNNNANFLVQGSILAAASIITRIIGLLYRIPLTNIIGNKGNGIYSAGFEIYSILLLLSSYSLPLAVSKLVSARVARGERRNAHRIFQCAMVFAVTIGLIFSVFTFVCSDFLASKVMTSPMSRFSLQNLAPTIFFVAVMGVLRGYFQGLGTMLPTAVSQIIEQIINAIVSVGAAWYLFSYGTKVGKLLDNEDYGPAFGAGGGTMGTNLGALAGLLFLIFLFFAYRKTLKRQLRRDKTRKKEDYGSIFYILMITIIPVILSTAVYNISAVLDQGIFNKVMAAQGQKDYNAIWGVFSGKYRLLTNVPISIASALASSTIPSLTAAMASRNRRAVQQKTAMAIRFIMVIAIPCAVGLTVLASPILRLLWGDTSKLAANLLKYGSISVVFYSMSTLTNGILQGINKMRIPVRNACIALVLHLGVLAVMLCGFKMHIYAVVYANIFFAFMMTVLNSLAIGRYLRYRQEMRRTFVIPAICAGFMGIFIYFVYKLLESVAGNAIATLVSIVLGAVVYFIALLLLKGITEEELMNMPKGRILVKAAKGLHLM